MKKILIPFLAFAVAVSSCNKQLDLAPTDAIDFPKAFTSVNDLEKGLLGVYAMNSRADYDGYNGQILIASILSDETKISSENRGQGQFTFKWQYSGAEAEHN